MDTNPSELQVIVPLVDGTAAISPSGVTLHRSPAAALAAPATTRWERDAIRGWTITAPTTLLPGVIELRIDGHALTPVLCAGRSETCLRFGTRAERVLEFTNRALMAMQADDTEELRTLAKQGLAAMVPVASVAAPENSPSEAGAAPESPPSEVGAQPPSVPPSVTAGETVEVRPAEDSAVSPVNASFIAFDVETANHIPGSICQFGWVRYEDGREVDSGTWLCQPPAAVGPWSDACIRVHGIQPQDVAAEPTCTERLEQFAALLREHPVPVVAHHARFDMTMLHAAAQLCFRELPPIQFHCTVRLSQNLMPGLANHKLPTVSAAVGHPVENHHDALADARACGEIFLYLLRNASADAAQHRDYPMLSWGQLCDLAGLHPGRLENGRVRQVRAYSQRERNNLPRGMDLFQAAQEG